MGSTTFYQSMRLDDPKNPRNVNKAFSDAVESAARENGHGWYTGTIAEKRSFVITGPEQPDRDCAFRQAKELIDNRDERVDDKWGPAGAILFRKGDEKWVLFFGWASE